MIKPFHQIHLKLLALLAAMVLWFIVITVENTVYKYPEQIEVKATNLSKNISLESELPKVDIYLRVDKDDLKKITKNDLEVTLDLQDVEAGEQSVGIIASSNNPLAQVLKVEPATVKIKVSPVIEKEVPIQIKVEGKPTEGYIVEKTEMEEDKVVVSGAQSIVDQIEYIEAIIILDGTQTETLKQSVQLSIPESLNISPQLVAYSPSAMVINVTISSQIEEKKLSIIPKFNSDKDKSAYSNKITISPESITVRGTKAILDKTTSIETSSIEVSLLIRNKEMNTGFTVPTGIELVNPSQTANIKLIERTINDGPTI